MCSNKYDYTFNSNGSDYPASPAISESCFRLSVNLEEETSDFVSSRSFIVPAHYRMVVVSSALEHLDPTDVFVTRPLDIHSTTPTTRIRRFKVDSTNLTKSVLRRDLVGRIESPPIDPNDEGRALKTKKIGCFPALATTEVVVLPKTVGKADLAIPHFSPKYANPRLRRVNHPIAKAIALPDSDVQVASA